MLIHVSGLNLSPREVKLKLYICLNLSNVHLIILCPNQLPALLAVAMSNPAWPEFNLVTSFQKAAYHCQSHELCWFPNTFLSFMALPEALVNLPFRHIFCILLVADGMPVPFSSPISSSPNKPLCKSFLVT